MTQVYPIILTPADGWYVVTVPDFDINTQGETYAEAMFMARDAICATALVMEDEGMTLPVPSELSAIHPENEGDVVALVDVDIAAYRRREEMRTVKKNCTIPSWLNYAAEQAGLNFSNLLAEAIREKLQLPERAY